MLSNFPVDVFDNYSSPALWPTFGIKLSTKADGNMVSNNLHGVFGFPMALLDTLINAYDRTHLDDPATTSRTIFVDTDRIRATDFGLTRGQREKIRSNGETAAKDFLKTWDYAKYLTTFVEPTLEAATHAVNRLNSK